jgi:hypothetical protein
VSMGLYVIPLNRLFIGLTEFTNIRIGDFHYGKFTGNDKKKLATYSGNSR